MPKTAKTTKPRSSPRREDSNQDRQQVHNYREVGGHEDEGDKETPSGAEEENEGDEVDTTMLGDYGPAIESPTLTIKDEIQAMYIRLLLGQMVVETLKED